jgi:hypothetical protein
MSYMSDADRLDNAKEHAARLGRLLGKFENQFGTKQRIYRMRAIIENEYIVVTLLQNVPGVDAGTAREGLVRVFVNRPYTLAAFGDAPPVTRTFTGQYAIDELVAFLALDKLEPDDVEWVDETRRTDLVVVSDIIKQVVSDR